MKSLSAFYPFVEPHCPGVTTPMMQQALRVAAIEFCSQTDLVQQVFQTSVVANEDNVDIPVPSQQQFCRLLGVQFKNDWLKIVTSAEAPAKVYNSQPSDPRAAWLDTPSDGPLVLYPTPKTSENNVLFIRASFSPTRSATQLEDVLFDDWVETIAAGAVAFLQATPGTQFFSPTAGAYRTKFDKGIASACRIGLQGRTSSSLRVKARSFV